MIGMVGGGYEIYWDTLLSFPVKLCHSFFGTSPFSFIVGIIAVFVLLSFLLKRLLWHMLFVAVLIIAVIGPLIPLGPGACAGRYFLVPWWVFSMGFAVVLGSCRIHKKIPLVFNLLLFFLVALAALIHGHMAVRAMEPIITRFDVQGRFLWESRKRPAVLYDPVTSHFGHYFSGLQWMKNHAKGISENFIVMGDEIELKALGDHPEDIWAYQAQSHSVEDISIKIPGILEPWQKKQRLMPLFFRLDYGKDKMAVWQCGPYPSGAYTLLSRDDIPEGDSRETLGMNKFPLSPSGQWRVNLEKAFFFYLRYDSPLGWTTYSPLLHFNPENEHFQWNRENASKTSHKTNKIME